MPSIPSAHNMHKYILELTLSFAVALTWRRWSVIARFCQNLFIQIKKCYFAEQLLHRLLTFQRFFRCLLLLHLHCSFHFFLPLLYIAVGIVWAMCSMYNALSSLNHTHTHTHCAVTLIRTVWWSNSSIFISNFANNIEIAFSIDE